MFEGASNCGVHDRPSHRVFDVSWECMGSDVSQYVLGDNGAIYIQVGVAHKASLYSRRIICIQGDVACTRRNA